MGKHEKEPQQSPIYETILPSWRFKELTQAILLAHADEVDQTGNSVEMMLPNSQKGDTYKIQWRRDFNPLLGGLTTYTLERYTGTSQPKNRYIVAEAQDGTIYQLKVYNLYGQEERHDKAGKRAACAEALRILSAAAPDKAKDTLNRATDFQYAIAVGSYILSDMALEGKENNLDMDVVWQAVDAYDQRMAHIEKAALNKAEHRDSEKYPQPYYYETVEEAVETRPVPSSVNRYLAVDVWGAAETVAEGMQRKWSSIIPAGSKRESSELTTTPEPATTADPESDQDA